MENDALKTWRELQKENLERQQGRVEEEQPVIEQPKQTERPLTPIEREVLEASKHEDLDLTDVALASGYGLYKHDTDIPLEDWIVDSQNRRAYAQSQMGKFGNGAAKLLPYAATTFVDSSIVGLAASLLNVGWDAVNGGEFHPGESFVDTPISRPMQQIRDWSERVLPNYRSEQEIADADKWWKHLNGNFWGDVFLKNVGFTIGAGLAGMSASGMLQSAKGKTFNRVYKAAVAASDGSADGQAAFQKVLQGARMQNASHIYDSVADAEKAFRKLSAEKQVIGGVASALGESRMEALTASDEYHKQFADKAANDYSQARQVILQSLLQDPAFTTQEPVVDDYGNPTGEFTPVLNERGKRAFEAYSSELNQKYQKAMGKIDDESRKIANTVFWLNMPLLAATETLQFGRAFAGGFKSQGRTFVKMLENGKYAGVGSVGNAIARGIGKAATEGFEEGSQKIFSEGAKKVAEENFLNFNSPKYNDKSTKNVGEWLYSMVNSADTVLREGSTWQEIAVGFLTGALPMPLGFAGGKVQWAGGIPGGIKEGLDDMKRSREAADKLNALFENPEFRNRWEGLVRHDYYENLKSDALAKNDEFTWHTANHAQFISDVQLFDSVDRLGDLEDFVDSLGTITEDQASEIKNTLFSQESDKEIFKMSDNDFVDRIRKRADDVKQGIVEYRNLRNSIDYLSFGSSDEAAISDLIYSQMQLNNFERRYNKVLDEVISQVRPTIENIAKEKDAKGNPTERAKKAQKLLADEVEMRTLFGGEARDIHGRGMTNTGDDLRDLMSAMPILVDDARQADVLEMLRDWGAFSKNPSIETKVTDLQNLVRSRADFYAKLFDPRGRFAEKSINENEEAKDKETGELKEEINQQKVDDAFSKLSEAKTVADYNRLYDEALESLNEKEVEELDTRIGADKRLSDLNNTGVKIFNDINSVKAKVLSKLEAETDPKKKQLLTDISNVLSNYDSVGSGVDAISDFISSIPEDESDPLALFLENILRQLGGDRDVVPILQEVLKEINSDNETIARINKAIAPTPVDKLPDLSVEGKSRGGTVFTGRYVDTVDDSGFHHIKLITDKGGEIVLRKKITKEQLLKHGITVEDILGNKEDWGDPEVYDKLLNSFEHLDIVGATIRPDGSIDIALSEASDGVPPVGEVAKEIFALAFPQWARTLGIAIPQNYGEDDPGKEGTTGGMATVYKFDPLFKNIAPSASTPEEVVDEVMKYIEGVLDEEDERLNKIANGSLFLGLTEEQSSSLVTAAQFRLSKIKSDRGEVGKTGNTETFIDEDLGAKENDAAHKARSEEFARQSSGSYVTATYNRYDSDALKKGRVVESLDRDGSDGKTKPGVNEQAYTSWMKEHKVQEFIDSGALVMLDDWYYGKTGQHLPIYFLANPHPSASNRLAHESRKGVSLSAKLIAVEITDEMLKMLDRYEAAGFFSQDNLITIDGVRYQVIGDIRRDKNGPTFIDSKGNRVLQVDNLYARMNIESIDRQYLKDRAIEGAKYPSDGKFYVAKRHPATTSEKPEDFDTSGERLHSTISYMMTGRNEITQPDPNNDGKRDKVPLAQSLHDYRIVNPNRYAFALKTGTGWKTTRQNSAVPDRTNASPGSLWIGTKEANGNIAWTCVTIARADEVGIKALSDEKRFPELWSALNTLFEPVSQEVLQSSSFDSQERKGVFAKKLAALKVINNIFYLEKGNSARFRYTPEGNVTLTYAGAFINGGDMESTSAEVVLQSSLELLSWLCDKRARFQVSGDDIVDPAKMDRLIEQGVLSSEMVSFIRRGANFGVNFLGEDGSAVVSTSPITKLSTDLVVAFGNDSRVGSSVIIRNNSYFIDKEGNVRMMVGTAGRSSVVNNPSLAASVKSLISLKEGKFEGSRYVVKTQTTVTYLYETVAANGIKVRFIKNGENGKYMLQENDDVWESYMQGAKKVTKHSLETNTDKTEGEKSGADYKAYKDAGEAPAIEKQEEEEGAVTAPNKKEGTGSNPKANNEGATIGLEGLQNEDDFDPQDLDDDTFGKTTQQQNQDEENDAEEDGPCSL